MAKKTYQLWQIVIAFLLGGLAIGAISFIPSFGTKGFFLKNAAEEVEIPEVSEISKTLELSDEIEEGVSEDENTVGEDESAAEYGVLPDNSGKIKRENCENIDIEIQTAQETLNNALGGGNKIIQEAAYDELVEVMKRKNRCR